MTGPTLLPIWLTSFVTLRHASSISSSPVRNTSTSPGGGCVCFGGQRGEGCVGDGGDDTAGSVRGGGETVCEREQGRLLGVVGLAALHKQVDACRSRCKLASASHHTSQLVWAHTSTRHTPLHTHNTLPTSTSRSLPTPQPPQPRLSIPTWWFTGVYLHHCANCRLQVVTLRLLGVEYLNRVQATWNLWGFKTELTRRRGKTATTTSQRRDRHRG